MTLHELDKIACMYGLHDFELSQNSRRMRFEDCKFPKTIELRKEFSSLGVIIVEVDQQSYDLVRKELHIRSDGEYEPIIVKLTEEQLKDLAYM